MIWKGWCGEPMNLFCIPFAGGSTYSYKGLSDKLHPSVHVETLELPGRGLRFSEPILSDSTAMVDDLYNRIKTELHEPYAFYGHSLGSLLAFLLACRIAGEGRQKPLYLFLSGCEAPSALSREKRHLLPKNEFRDVIRRFGGCSPEVLDNEELMEIFEPVLRADFKAYETYVHEAGSRLDVPIAVMTGDEEELEREDVMKWQAETSSKISIATFSGDHFFIYRHWDKIAGIISGALNLPHR